VFAGTDPSDGRFFVAKKGIFNKNPKVYKTDADIDADTSGDLNRKLKLALKYLPDLNIQGVIQGDFLYSKSDLKTVDIDGEPHITFHPNTIVYAIPEKSGLAKQIRRSEIGVVWHTTYRGQSFETMRAGYGEEIASSLSKSTKVWSVDAIYRDVSGVATFTDRETEQITKILSRIGTLFNQVEGRAFRQISNNEELLIRMTTYINAHIRRGERIRNTDAFVRNLVNYIIEYYTTQESKRKTERGKSTQRQKRNEVLNVFSNIDKRQIVAIFDMYNLIIDAKLMIISKLDQAKRLRTLLLTPNGYKVTGQEGFVAIDHLGRNAVKLVDRLQFSHANFSPNIAKGWQR